MCLAVPLKITKIIDENEAIAELEGIERSVNISLIDEPLISDYVIVHTGFAIRKIDAEEASKTLALFDEINRM